MDHVAICKIKKSRACLLALRVGRLVKERLTPDLMSIEVLLLGFGRTLGRASGPASRRGGNGGQRAFWCLARAPTASEWHDAGRVRRALGTDPCGGIGVGHRQGA